MKEEIWVVEVNLDNISPNEFRVKKADDMLKINAVRALIKAGGLPTKIELVNWVAVAMAFGEKQANRKMERFRDIYIAEKAHADFTGESLHLNL